GSVHRRVTYHNTVNRQCGSAQTRARICLTRLSPAGRLTALATGRSRCWEKCNGGVAQLGERVNGIHEVRGSIPLASIKAGGAAAGASECSCAGRAEYIGSEPARLRE